MATSSEVGLFVYILEHRLVRNGGARKFVRVSGVYFYRLFDAMRSNINRVGGAEVIIVLVLDDGLDLIVDGRLLFLLHYYKLYFHF